MPISERQAQEIIESLTRLQQSQQHLKDDFCEKLDLLTAGFTDRLSHIQRKLETTHELLTGNGEPAKGMLIRVDRLEQIEQRRGRVWWALVLASVSSVVAAFWKTILGK